MGEYKQNRHWHLQNQIQEFHCKNLYHKCMWRWFHVLYVFWCYNLSVACVVILLWMWRVGVCMYMNWTFPLTSFVRNDLPFSMSFAIDKFVSILFICSSLGYGWIRHVSRLKFFNFTKSKWSSHLFSAAMYDIFNERHLFVNIRYQIFIR